MSKKVTYGMMGIVGITSCIGSMIAVDKVIDVVTADRAISRWEKELIRQAGYTIACGAAILGTYKVIDFVAADIPNILSIVFKNK